MGTQRSFGRTWWGNAWVEAMERIDYNTNRLPRGRRYANNGSVKAIDIKDGEVIAKVKGSRPRPYDIKICLKRFNDSQVKRIKGVIENNPAVASELNRGRLPESLLPVLNEQKIHIFPGDWDEITANCSCPDWANPCKHLAAVYYILANEIDKAPFLIFNLKGVSAQTLAEAAGLTNKRQIDAGDLERDIFIPYEQVKAEIKGKEDSLEPPDLSFQGIDIDSMFSLLPDSPLFYTEGDFKRMLLHVYKEIMKAAEMINITEGNDHSFKGTNFFLVQDTTMTVHRTLLQKEVFRNAGFMFFAATDEAVPPKKGSRELYERIFGNLLIINSKTNSIKIPVLRDNKLKFVKQRGIAASTDSIFGIFLSLPLDTSLDNNSVSSRFLNLATSVALALLRGGAFIPEVVMKEGYNAFTIRYAPLVHDEKIRDLMDDLKGIMPLNFGFRKDKGDIMTEDGVYDVMSMILTHFVHRVITADVYDGKLIRTFFSGEAYEAERFQERQTAKAVSDWLERLHIRQKDISPVIRIETEGEDSFAVEIDVENKRDPMAPVIPLSRVFDSKDMVFSYPADTVRTDVSRQVSIAGEYMANLLEVLNSRGREKAIISSTAMSDFMTGGADILTLLGIRVIIPKELKRLVMPRIAIKAEKKGKGAISYLSLDDLRDFSWEIAIGDKTISGEEFIKLAKKATGIVRFNDQYILLKPQDVKNIVDRINKPLPALSSMDIIHAAFIGEVEGMLFNPGIALRKVLDQLTRVEDIKIPAALNACLRPYQERGFRWLYSNTVKGFGSCIADDMGLGKTIQIITLILRLKEDGKLGHPALVVCPTTLVGNWQKECQRFAPGLGLSIYHGMERELVSDGSDVIITTYGILRRDIGIFRAREWGMVVIDEAQNIKNPDTDQTKAVKSLRACSYIAMSGTPVENRLSELWSIFDFINRGYLGQAPTFQRQYATPVEKYRDREKIERLRRATAPFLLRRLKSDKTIISDLPDKLMFDEYCYLSKEQAALYKQVVDKTMKEIGQSDGITRKGMIFKLITSLKQICNHPVHYSKKGHPVKGLSGKAEKMIELTGKMMSMREKAIIFTQYKEMGGLLVDIIRDDLKEDALFFHGGITRVKRDKMVEAYQTDNAVRLMIISLKAGGTGINLTAAANVIHYDLWWNPAVEAQATDRAYRIGQDKNVMVHRLITIGTFEEKIDEMIKAKKELADLTVSTGEQWITELSNRELKELFSLTG